MISKGVKRKLLEELAKSGNVFFACARLGIDRSTYYRWRQEDKRFDKSAELAQRLGRENICDIAEHALMINVKKGQMEAIKYALCHNSPRYKPSQVSQVIFEHRGAKKNPEKRGPTLTQLIWEATREEEKRKKLDQENEERVGLRYQDDQIQMPNAATPQINPEAERQNLADGNPLDPKQSPQTATGGG